MTAFVPDVQEERMTAADPHNESPSATRDETVEVFAATLRRLGAPQWLGQVNCGVLGVHEHVLGAAGAAAAGRCREAARLLSLECAKQDTLLESVRTGRLIRVVVETPRGAAFCFPIVPDEHVVAFLVDTGQATAERATRAADDVLIELSAALRDERGLPNLDPGGRSGAAHPIVRTADGPITVQGRAEGPLGRAAQRALHAETLQWIAHVRGWSIEFTADRFGDERTGRHFKVRTPAERRRFYADIAAGIDAVSSGLSRFVRPVVGGPARRVSLDVEQGVIVVQRLGPREHLVGVTLMQSRVAEVEDIVARLAADHAHR